jgi:hypothetical protein
MPPLAAAAAFHQLHKPRQGSSSGGTPSCRLAPETSALGATESTHTPTQDRRHSWQLLLFAPLPVVAGGWFAALAAAAVAAAQGRPSCWALSDLQEALGSGSACTDVPQQQEHGWVDGGTVARRKPRQ